MTNAGFVAVPVGGGALLLLTAAPAYEAAHLWVDAVLWACWAYFLFEWAVRLRHARALQRGFGYSMSVRGLVAAVAVIAGPWALVCGVWPRAAWLLAVLWVLQAAPGLPGLRQVRRVLA